MSSDKRYCRDGGFLFSLTSRPHLFLLIVTVTLIVCGIWSQNNAFATNSAISVNVTQSTASLDISPSDTGTFANSGTDIAFSVNTTNVSGYKLSIAASNDTNDAANLTQTVVKNEQTSVYRINSIGTVTGVTSSGISEATFSNSGNTQYNNTWGYKPNKLNSANNSNYLPAPTGTGSSAAINLDTTSVAGTNNYTINIGARVNAAIPTGTYSNTFVITAVANLINYEITYDRGTAAEGTVSNLPSSQIGVISDPTTDSTNITLASNIPARTGYAFVNWCSVMPTTVNNTDNCSGVQYRAGGIYDLDATTSSNITLYAMWSSPLYDKVAAMSKGTQTPAQLQETITAPTSADRTQDTSNSGVYEYDSSSSAFGPASDAANTSTIYYYRGILDSYGNTGTYGSDGLADAYPNYVVLSSANSKSGLTTGTDTCWRIVRTTGSGGVKMIYNGTWTGSTCANATTNAAAISRAYFNRGSTISDNNYETIGRIAYVGYNYNSDYGYGGSGATESNSIANSTLFSNGTASNARTQLESWYNSNMAAYTNILETSAGWCSDRTTYTVVNSAVGPPVSSNVPYKTSGAFILFGAYTRNFSTNSSPTLGCPNPTGYDLLTTSNGLGVPAALLTADEASFAGSGSETAANGSSYHTNSYLRSGSRFWFISPRARNSSGSVYAFALDSGGYLTHSTISSDSNNIRPTISLRTGTVAIGGAGTATDPWIVNSCNPNGTTIGSISCMQDISSANKTSVLASMQSGAQYQLMDNRDNKIYYVSKLADGNIWMTQNLDLCIGCTNVAALTSENTHLTASGSGAYSSDYTSSNGVITWTPAATAITSSYTISDTTVSPAWPTNNYTAPYSAEGGDVYVYTSGSTSDDTVFTSLFDCMATGGHAEAECAHYHVGNYYSWSAAIASNNSSSYSSQYVNAVNDICPAGWRLPKGRASTDTVSTREFGELFRAAGITSSLTATSYATNGFNNVRIAPLYFVRGGSVNGGSLHNRESNGNYWSSTVSNSNVAYNAIFSSSDIHSDTISGRPNGQSVRCVAQ